MESLMAGKLLKNCARPFSEKMNRLLRLSIRSCSECCPDPCDNTPSSRKTTSADGGGAKGPRDKLDVSFSDPVAAFKSKTTMEIARAYFVYQLCSVEYIVEHNMKLMKFANKVLGNKLFEMLMKASFYGHFVGGEDEFKIKPTLDRLRSFGVKPILDYSVEEDLSQEEAEEREVKAIVPEKPDNIDHLKQFQIDTKLTDRRYKVQSARTYFYLDEPSCERNMEIFLKSLDATADMTQGTGITAVKLTALGKPQLLLQISEVILKARRYMTEIMGGTGSVLSHHTTREEFEKKIRNAKINDTGSVKQFLDSLEFDDQGILHLFPWSGIVDENQELSSTFKLPDLKNGRMVSLISQLSPKEEQMFRNMIRRMTTLAKTARDKNLRLMVDAEQTYFQPAISRITLEFMRKYNTERAIVFNTYQCYLQETFNEVQTDLEQAQRQNFYFAAKLVRGAYIEQERARAASLGYPDPTNPNVEATTDSYHRTLTECLRRIKKLKEHTDEKKIAIMVASHNEDTVRFAIQQMKEIGIRPEEKVICFGQLLGMCDFITFPLGQSGYSVYKYVPYGPVNEVLPYLSRRAIENKGVLKKIKKEKKLLLSELFRRIKKGQFKYTPKGNYTPV